MKFDIKIVESDKELQSCLSIRRDVFIIEQKIPESIELDDHKIDAKYLYQYDDHVNGISSFDFKHLIKHGVKKKHIIKQKVNSITVNELLLKYKYDNFDLLFVDAEGYGDGHAVSTPAICSRL